MPIYGDLQVFTDKPILAFLVITVEIIGIGGIVYLINREEALFYQKSKYILNIVFGIILLALLLSLYLSYAMTQISFF